MCIRDSFKVIYGVEAYLVDDTKSIVTNPDGQDFSGEFVVFDLETTGFSALVDTVIDCLLYTSICQELMDICREARLLRICYM